MMKKIKKICSFILCLALIMCNCVAITPTVSAADSGKILKINWDHIRTVGNQDTRGYACSCFALAYATTIMDGTPRQWWLYNQNQSKDQYNVTAYWGQSNSGFNSLYPTTEQEMYGRMKDAVEHGRPSVVLVRKTTTGTQQHYVTVVGYTGAGNKASDFLIIDPAGGATKGAPENMGGLNYTLKKRTQGHHLGLYHFVFTDKSGIGTVGYPSEAKPTEPAISFSPSNLSVNVGDSKTVSINFKGDGIKSIGGTINGTSICGASFGNADWNKGTTSLTVTGKKAGNATITVNLKDENGKIFYSKSFSVTVVKPVEPIEVYLFDADVYYNLYGDLQRAFKKGDTAALKNHWEKFGKSEGRKASLFFDPIWYLNNNADLKRAYGSDYVQAYDHFVKFGFKEGRSGSPIFNARTYLNLHADLKKAFNTDYLAAVNHFKKFGVNEQRRASDLLDIKAYLAKYPSVKTKYTDKLGYFIDYMRSSEYGKSLISYSSPTPTPAPTPTVKPTATPVPTPTVRPTATPTVKPTTTPTPTPTPTTAPTATPTPVPTPTVSPAPGSLNITGVTARNAVYNGQSQVGYTGTPYAEGAEVKVTYTGRNGTSYNSSVQPQNAGNYTVTFTADNGAAHGELSRDFTIIKASITIRADNKNVEIGGNLPELTYTVTGLASGDILAVKPTLSYATQPDLTAPAGYVIKASGARVPSSGNYNEDITYIDGLLNVYPGGEPTPTPDPTPEPGHGTEIYFAYAKCYLTPGKTLELVALDSSAEPYLGQLEWWSDDTNVAEVDNNGNVTARGNGSAVIRAGTTDGIYTASCEIIVGPWYQRAVDYVMQEGLMGGYSDGSFGANDRLSRAQLAQILYNKEGRPVVTVTGKFSDIREDAWYSKAVSWAAEQKIVSGYSNGKFGHGDPITRQDLAVMLWRYAGSPDSSGSVTSFSDADKISSYAENALRWAVENRIMSGNGGKLNPRGYATRAEVAQMLMNYLSK